MNDPVAIWILVGMLGGIFAYPVLQYLAFRRMQASWRFWALLPVGPMGFVLGITAYAFSKRSNVWPLPLIFFGPPALLYLGVLFALHELIGRRKIS